MNKVFFNPAANGAHPGARVYDRENADRLRTLFGHSPSFAPTPLQRLDGLAARMEIGELWAKDERDRWGLGSFKSLGGAFAVVELAADFLSRREESSISPADIFAGRAPQAREMTVATATAGNHGRAVAFGAKLAGTRAVIFVYGDVPKRQRQAIADLGAELVSVEGDYEAACRAAAKACAAHGWIMVSDVAEKDYTEIPERIMRGYCVLAAEALEQLPQPPTHVILQAGVGGLATPVASYFRNCLSPGAVPGKVCSFFPSGTATKQRTGPRIAVVEAATVPCLMESARNNRETRTLSTGPTNLNRLDCPTPSSSTWPVLRALASVFVGVDSETAAEAAALLRQEGLSTTPTGAAGLAGLLALSRESGAFDKFELNGKSRVLIVMTEEAVE
ncbi:MAG TPA: diaminopropionate ammonia-lyase [Rhizomicrobium sp.]|nr:diaminopropionate ammonia-lyase [Rhizomicrobium sp.]